MAVIIGANVLFTGAVLYIFYMTGSEPVALVGAFFGFTTGELWALASIRKTKAKAENRNSGKDAE